MEIMSDASSVEKMLLLRARREYIPANGSIELLPVCNLNCKMCYVRLSREEMEKQGGLRSAEEWIKAAKEMKEAGVLFLLLTGGEPLLYPELKELFLELKKMGMVLTMNTNGTLLNEEWADFFGEHKPRRINVTLYGSHEETYRELCGAPEGFQKALNGIKLLKDRGVDVKIAGSATKANKNDIMDICKIGKDLDLPVSIDTYMIPAVRERNIPYDFQARLEAKEAAKVRVDVLKMGMGEDRFLEFSKKTMAESKLMISQPERQEPIRCMAGVCSFSINWKGNLRPCVMLDHPSASVFEMGFQNAWEKVMTGAKQLRTSSQCSICRYRTICRICVASAWMEEGSYDSVPKYMCEYAEECFRLMEQELEKVNG